MIFHGFYQTFRLGSARSNGSVWDRSEIGFSLGQQCSPNGEAFHTSGSWFQFHVLRFYASKWSLGDFAVAPVCISGFEKCAEINWCTWQTFKWLDRFEYTISSLELQVETIGTVNAETAETAEVVEIVREIETVESVKVVKTVTVTVGTAGIEAWHSAQSKPNASFRTWINDDLFQLIY